MGRADIVPQRHIARFPLVANLQFGDLAHVVGNPDQRFADFGIIALDSLDIGIADEQAGLARGVVTHHCRMHRMFAVGGDLFDHGLIPEIVAHRQIERIMLHLDIAEQQLQAFGQTVNVLKGKKLTNIRAAGKDEALTLTPPMRLTLEKAMSYIADDELVEITPDSIRLRKRWLDPNERKKQERKREADRETSAA